ncbi:hypothetical protein ABW20_dc0100269 [Dactylellina cionopaga]|nr:hypothetical protein ABW20_dc0100269 [Dactylellina cionopaga]
MAHNNHFFFESLSPVPTSPGSMLLATVEESFGHIEILKETMLATALACFSNAFVWLVIENTTRKLRILTTYNAGTPYGLAHRRQAVDTNTTTRPAPVGATDGSTIAAAIQNSNEFESPADAYTEMLAKLPEELAAAGRKSTFSPLLCVNVWEHAWVADYSFDKKEEYLNKWWDAVDWGVVWARLEPLGFAQKPSRPFMGTATSVRDGADGYGGTRLADQMKDRSLNRM